MANGISIKQPLTSTKSPMTTHTQILSIVSGKVPADISKTDFRRSLVSYEISRFEIENCLTERLVNDLRVDQKNPFIHAGPGRVIFHVSGFDDDPRELYEIPEFAAFIRQANKTRPCWTYYAAVESRWLQIVAYCTTAAFQGLPGKGHRMLCLPLEESAKFLRSQLGDHEKLCSLAKVPRKKIKANLKQILQSFQIKW